MALDLQLLPVQILTNNVQVLIFCLSYSITTVSKNWNARPESLFMNYILQKWSFCLERWKTKMSMFHVTTIEFPQRFENPGPVFNFGFMFVRVSQWGEISVWSRILIFMSLRFDEIFLKNINFYEKLVKSLIPSEWFFFGCEFRNYFTKFWVR